MNQPLMDVGKFIREPQVMFITKFFNKRFSSRTRDDWMKKNDRTSEKFVFPGERLGVIEEFLPGRGTYVEDGNIYSLTTGRLLLDTVNREVLVHSKARTPLIPKKGDVVIGCVSNVQDKNLTIRIFQIDDEGVNGSFTGVMHISDASGKYVKTMFDIFNVGDITRAKVISTMNREFHLTTQGDDLGVLQANCSRCGHQLVLKNKLLRCSSCNGSERRKVASDYEKDS